MSFALFFDKKLNPIGQPIFDIELKQVKQRPNGSSYVSFSVPYDVEDVHQLESATFITIYDSYHEVASGYIDNRDLSDTEYNFTIQGHAQRLKSLKTPQRWVLWNNRDLANVVRDHLNEFKIKRWNTKNDWEQTIKHQVDIDTEPGSVILAYEPHPNDPDNERPKEHGYIQVRVDLGGKALKTNRIIRWSETVGSEVRIAIQTRTAETPELLDSADWSAEATAIHVDEIDENETKGVPVVSGGRWIDIRVNLYTFDIESERRDSNGEIISYGFSPLLEGLELIWREPSFLVAGNMPQETGVIVQGFEFQRTDFLSSLAEICGDYGWEFNIRHDTNSKEIVLDLGTETVNGWKPTLGIDRSINSDNPMVFEHGRNIEISVLRDNVGKLANVLHCWGAGEGTKQLYTKLENEDSINRYGKFEDDFADTDLDTIGKLIEAGQHELEKRSYPDVVFEVSIPLDDLGELYGVKLGDMVTVVHPRNKTIVDTRVMEFSIQTSVSSKLVKLGLNGFLINPIERLLAGKSTHKTLGEIPSVPKQVQVASSLANTNVITWISDADSWAIRARLSNSEWRYFDSKTTSFIHSDLEPSDVWEYQVASIKNGRISEWSSSVWGKVLGDPDDAYAVGIVGGISVGFSSKPKGWRFSELHVSIDSDFIPSSNTLKESGSQTRFDLLGLTPGKLYYARLIHVTEQEERIVSKEVSAIAQFTSIDALPDHSIGADKFVQDLRPPIMVTSKPIFPDPRYPNGTILFYTVDKKLYEVVGNDWEPINAGTVTADEIMAGIIEAGGITGDYIHGGTISYDNLEVSFAKVPTARRGIELGVELFLTTHSSGNIDVEVVQTARTIRDMNIIKLTCSNFHPNTVNGDFALRIYHNDLQTLTSMPSLFEGVLFYSEEPVNWVSRGFPLSYFQTPPLGPYPNSDFSCMVVEVMGRTCTLKVLPQILPYTGKIFIGFIRHAIA